MVQGAGSSSGRPSGGLAEGAAEKVAGHQAMGKVIERLMHQLRVPSSHAYAKGKDVVVVAQRSTAGDLLGEIGTAWHQREQRVMHPSVASRRSG